MDTETVLNIIAMLDARFENIINDVMNEDIEEEAKKSYLEKNIDLQYLKGKCEILGELTHHLQEYIELQVTQAENALGE
jgi:hypothetical protein